MDTAYKIIPLTITMQFGDITESVHPTVLWDENSVILIDCGFIGSFPVLEEELKRHGLTPGQITGILLTHHDHDHMGAAAEIKRQNPNVILYASSKEAPYISAEEKPLRLVQAEALQESLPVEHQAFGEAFCNMLRQVEPVQVDRLLQGGENLDWCGGCRIISTPGHTPGHISLFMTRKNIVITGDAIALAEGVPVIANPQFTLDMTQAEKSMGNLLAMKADAYYCYHGGIYTPPGKE